MEKLTWKNIFLKVNLFTPPIFWAGLIFFLSDQPELSSGLPNIWDFILRKTAHISEYAILTFLIFRAFRKYEVNKTDDIGKYRLLLFSVIISLFYAFSDEYHQTFIEGRAGKLSDAGIDSLGIIFACYLVWKAKNK